jgi:hypothetical protein
VSGEKSNIVRNCVIKRLLDFLLSFITLCADLVKYDTARFK